MELKDKILSLVDKQDAVSTLLLVSADFVQHGKVDLRKALEKAVIIIGSNVIEKRYKDSNIQIPYLSKKETIAGVISLLKEKYYSKKTVNSSLIETGKMVMAIKLASLIIDGTQLDEKQSDAVFQQ